MSGKELSRRAGVGRAAAPVRLVHLGLGNFFRAHQAWYTEHAPDAETWGIAAFSGRSRNLPDKLTAQQGLYTLVMRGAEGDQFELISSLSAAYSGNDHDTWLRLLSSPEVAVVTVT
ncbi:MAG: mannitol dehydrogenase family protein, partial [Actinomycetota bacterium]|nr:mannitol dehydrogenase family protein [Actinomycetota bacterium]